MVRHVPTQVYSVSKLILIIAAAILALNSCRTPTALNSQVADTTAAAPASGTASRLGRCAAVRGNGELIFGHFASLARLIEQFGMLDAMAGGSSASITSFLYESIYANPSLRDCNGTQCSANATAVRAALLLKSIQGYLATLGNDLEVAAFNHSAPIVAKLSQGGLAQLASVKPSDRPAALLKFLKSAEFGDLVNPEVIALLEHSPTPAKHAKDIYDEIQFLGKLSADDQMIFFRPGLVNFKAVADLLGRVGSFYAGYGPYDAPTMQAFMNACAAPGRGRDWQDVASLAAGSSGKTCGDLFSALVSDYRHKFAADKTHIRSRADDPVGKYLPVLVSTSVLNGQDVSDAYHEALKVYFAGGTPDLHVTFDKIRFGYWGRSEDLQTVEKNSQHYNDLKTKKFLGLGEATWREILAISPAEPGLARFQEIDNTKISAGGWSDLHPVLVLKNLGCQQVIYVTRRGNESDFALGVAKHLGMGKAEEELLYDLDRGTKADGTEALPSAYLQSVTAADGVWCTNWNAFKPTQMQGLTTDAYNAPFEARSSTLRTEAASYPNTKAAVNFRGCTPGASASAL